MKSFVSHYILQRITAFIFLMLFPWFLWSLFTLRNADYLSLVKNFGNPYSTILLFFMLTSGFYHGYLGIHNIFLDYIHNIKIRLILIFLTAVTLSLLSIFSTICLMRLTTL